MGRVLAVAMAMLWITSPLQLTELPHLRDYAKAPFFMFSVCGIAWITLTRASRRTTVVALALMGAVIGFGFGLRTDVATYLPLVAIAVMVFRPDFERADLATRGLAAAACVLGFLIVAWPIIGAYQTGDNLGHVAILGLSDPSRDWLRLSEAPYSFGGLYHDKYVETVLAAYSERLSTVIDPLQQGTPAYAKWGNDYYSTLVTTFPGDILVRAWAAVLGVCQLPFDQINVMRPSWIDPSFEPIFASRGTVLSWLDLLPPVAAVAILAIGIGTVSLRLGLVFTMFAAIMPGMTSLQYQLRHVFHLEVLSLFAYGCLLHCGWRLVRHRALFRLPLSRPILVRAAFVAAALAVLVAAPVAAARTYQNGTVAKLFSTYESAEVVNAGSPAVVQDGNAMVPVSIEVSRQTPKWVDTNVLSIQVSGAQCDTDILPIKLRYRMAFGDYTRQALVPVPRAGERASRFVFPLYTPGAKSTTSDSLRFAGVEMPARQLSCIQSIERFTAPERFPLLLESLLVSDWRSRPAYEALRNVEAPIDDWRTDFYSIPDGLQPGRTWLSHLETKSGPTIFQSHQVTKLDSLGIEIQGRADTVAAYLVAWPDEPRPQGSVFFVEGRVINGGMSVGVQQNERWVHVLDVLRPGRFRAAIRVDAPGAYRAVLANHQVQGPYARISIDRYGWLPPEE
jgi:hypothetical protein